MQKAGGLCISADCNLTSSAGGARWSWGGRLGQQVTVDLKSKQRPMRESSAPAIPAICSQPPPALYRLKETILPSATGASPSSEVSEVATWWGGAEGGSARTIQGLCMSLWGSCGLGNTSSDASSKPGNNAQTSETPRTLEASIVPNQGSGCILQPPSCT